MKFGGVVVYVFLNMCTKFQLKIPRNKDFKGGVTPQEFPCSLLPLPKLFKILFRGVVVAFTLRQGDWPPTNWPVGALRMGSVLLRKANEG